MELRIALPNMAIASQVNSAGCSLINIFTSDLFDFIDAGLMQTKGKNWQVELQIQNMGADKNFRDPSVLLKELVQKGQSPLRGPVSAKIPQVKWKEFYQRLDELLGERHLWVHNEIKADIDQLKSLVILVKKISLALELAVTTECQAIMEHISPSQTEIPIETPEPDREPSVIAAALGKFTKDDEVPVGSPLAGPFTSHTYTLHLNGSVRDRSSEQLLSELTEDGDTLGALLIARKPNGGRLRITTNGEVAAYFGEFWGFLAKVEKNSWFPGHF